MGLLGRWPWGEEDGSAGERQVKGFLKEKEFAWGSGREVLEGVGGVSGVLTHSFPLSPALPDPSLKWPKEALDQLKRKQRVNFIWGLAFTLTRHFQGASRTRALWGYGSGVGSGERNTADDPDAVDRGLPQRDHLPPQDLVLPGERRRVLRHLRVRWVTTPTPRMRRPAPVPTGWSSILS